MKAMLNRAANWTNQRMKNRTVACRRGLPEVLLFTAVWISKRLLRVSPGKRALGVIAVSVGLLLGEGTIRAAESESADDGALCVRALVSEGDTARVQRVLVKARRGEAITVGVIGGSITQGALASRPENRYGALIAGWLRASFPKAVVNLVNAGIGATGSNYGALRARRDLLSQHPDLVIIEYAVNDGNTQASAETLEGLIRQIFKQKEHPAVLLLFMMNQQGANAQEWFGKVGEHYHLPMVSYRDALWPEIRAGRMAWTDISPDAVHPNDRGHAYTARFVNHFLESVSKRLPADSALPEILPSPKPRFTDLYERTALFEGDALKPVANRGWSFDVTNRCWKSALPGSVVEFEIEGEAVFTMHWVVRGPMGRARVSVDGGASKVLDAWFDQTWGGYRQTGEAARDLASGKHRIRFELLDDKSPQSPGREFRILGLGAAGCRGGEAEKVENRLEVLEAELVRDPHFQNGFVLLKPKAGERVPYAVTEGLSSGPKPVWDIAQWSSKLPLAASACERLPLGSLRYTNEAKKITIGRQGSAEADVSLAVLASVEYGPRARRSGEPWVHLLVQQDIENSPTIAQLTAARLQVEAKLLRSEKVATPDYSPGLHAAQFQIFFSVQNRRRESPGFGQYLWFGIPLFDDRQRIPAGHKAQDTGDTGMFIYTPAGDAFTSKSAHDKDWITIDKDLLPLMREGLETAWQRGFLKDSHSFADYRISSMNMGWEVPGIFDVEMQVRNLSLKVTFLAVPNTQ